LYGRSLYPTNGEENAQRPLRKRTAMVVDTPTGLPSTSYGR
jgi:hypothetical protein